MKKLQRLQKGNFHLLRFFFIWGPGSLKRFNEVESYQPVLMFRNRRIEHSLSG
jgi:hypothetical protein